MDNGKHPAVDRVPAPDPDKPMRLDTLELRRFQASVQRRGDLQNSIVTMAMTLKAQREQFDALVEALGRENVDFANISTAIAQRFGIMGMFDVNVEDGLISLK
jgi:hypothetical protein